MTEPQMSLLFTAVALSPILAMALIGAVWELGKWIKRKVSPGRLINEPSRSTVP